MYIYIYQNKIQAMHGCRQFVFWYVWLSSPTNETLKLILFVNYLKIYKYFFIKKKYKFTTNETLDEGEDYVKSLCPLYAGLSIWYNDFIQRVAEICILANLKNYLKYGLYSETWLYEGGIVSNRLS